MIDLPSMPRRLSSAAIVNIISQKIGEPDNVSYFVNTVKFPHSRSGRLVRVRFNPVVDINRDVTEFATSLRAAGYYEIYVEAVRNGDPPNALIVLCGSDGEPYDGVVANGDDLFSRQQSDALRTALGFLFSWVGATYMNKITRKRRRMV